MIPPLAFLRGREPPRTITRNINPFTVRDSGNRTFSIEFFASPKPGEYFSRQVFPNRKADAPDNLAAFYPPPHYHPFQDEHFKVESGAGIWHLWNGQSVRLKEGDEIVVPARSWHWFENDPDSKLPLSVVYKYEKPYVDMETRFFRNVFSYTEDCRKAGVDASKVQLLVFCMHAWNPLAIWGGGPEWLNMLVNTLLTIAIGGFGQLALGYKSSYPEYYDGGQKEE